MVTPLQVQFPANTLEKTAEAALSAQICATYKANSERELLAPGFGLPQLIAGI